MDATEPLPAPYRRAHRACGATVATIAALALLGWLADWHGLREVRAGYIPMAPNTALALLVLGVALLIVPERGVDRGRRRLAGLAVGTVGLLTALRLVEYASGVDLAVDAWFLRVPSEAVGLAPVGKMALFTAATLLLASVALMLLVAPTGRGPGDLAGALALLVASIGLVFGLGYLYESPLLYGSVMIPMALNTALAVMLLGSGLVAAAGPGAFPMRLMAGPSVRARLLRFFLPSVAGMVALVGWTTHLVTKLAGASYAALWSAVSAVVAILLVGLISARIARRVGAQLECAEEALRQAHDELEARVERRTRELVEAKVELEERNRQLQALAADLAAQAQAIRLAHGELQAAHEELQRAEGQLVQAEKLSALGQMVAGVAHEINNPLAFVSNNLAVLQRDVGSLSQVLRLYQQAEGPPEARGELLARIRDLAERVDLPYLLENLDGIVGRSREGVRRIQQIVRDLRDFARVDAGDLAEVDLNGGIVSTINIIRGQAEKQGVALAVELRPLPGVTCYPGKVNQVVLNLLANAVDACGPGDEVTVSTRPGADDGVEIHVADTGEGIEPAILDKIFDPFFTTKPVGKGTGLGLSISYGIVRAHGGRIEVDSAPGRGAHFVVHLPRMPPSPAPPSAAGRAGTRGGS